MKAAVFGAGSWGTAFAKVLVDAGNDVTLWAAADAARTLHPTNSSLPFIRSPSLPLMMAHEPKAAVR